MHSSHGECWPCTGPLSYGSNLLCLLAGHQLGGEAAACAPPQEPVWRCGAGCFRWTETATACNLAEPGLSAAVTAASGMRCAHFNLWHGALSPLLCMQEGVLRQGRCLLEESANHDRADLDAADGGLPSQQDAADGGLPSQQDAAEVGLPSQQVAAEVGLLGLLHAPDGGLPSQPLVPGEECLA